MDLRNQQIKETYGNLATINTVAGTPTTGVLQNGAGSNVTAMTLEGSLTAQQLNADNLRLDGNTISSTDTNGNIIIEANGTGDVIVNEGGGDSDFRVEGSTDTNLLFVDASANRIGVGTATPTAKMVIASASPSVASRGTAYLYSTDSMGIDLGGQLSFGGSYTGTTETIFAAVAGRKQSITNLDISGYLQFSTTNVSLGLVERMRIDSSGNVGIGTTSPVSGKLQVNHSNTESGIYVLEDNAGIAVSGLANFGGVISAPAIRFETSSTERFLVKTAEVVVNDPSNDVDFRVEGLNDTHLIFADAGNDRVGISTSSPSKLFHVAGTAHLPQLNGSTSVTAAENVAKTITYTISAYQTGVMHVMYASVTGTAWGSGRQLYTSVYFGKSGGNAGVVTLNAGDTTDANAGDLSVTASGGDIVIAKTAGSGGNNGTLNIMIVSNDDIGQPVIT